MMVTEAGYHSQSSNGLMPSTERIQANYVAKLFTQAIASDIKAQIWWTWNDLPGYPFANGLLTSNMTTKEAYSAYQAAVNRLGASTYQSRISAAELETGDDVEAYLFSGPGPCTCSG